MRVTLDIPREPSAPAVARAAVRELDGVLAPDRIAEVSLLVSELVTNSVKYGDGPSVHLLIDASDPGALQVSVIDAGAGFTPVPRTRPATEVGGWGLRLVEQLSDRWGVEADTSGVWFETRDGRDQQAAA